MCVCVCVSGASGVAGVRPAAAEEVGLCGHLRRRDDHGGEGHRHSGPTRHMTTQTRATYSITQRRVNAVDVLCLCLQCVAESVLQIEEIDTEVVTK